jgi:hypothetical protein
MLLKLSALCRRTSPFGALLNERLFLGICVTAHGAKRHFMVPGGQLMAKKDKSCEVNSIEIFWWQAPVFSG